MYTSKQGRRASGCPLRPPAVFNDSSPSTYQLLRRSCALAFPCRGSSSAAVGHLLFMSLVSRSPRPFLSLSLSRVPNPRPSPPTPPPGVTLRGGNPAGSDRLCSATSYSCRGLLELSLGFTQGLVLLDLLLGVLDVLDKLQSAVLTQVLLCINCLMRVQVNLSGGNSQRNDYMRLIGKSNSRMSM